MSINVDSDAIIDPKVETCTIDEEWMHGEGMLLIT